MDLQGIIWAAAHCPYPASQGQLGVLVIKHPLACGSLSFGSVGVMLVLLVSWVTVTCELGVGLACRQNPLCVRCLARFLRCADAVWHALCLKRGSRQLLPEFLVVTAENQN